MKLTEVQSSNIKSIGFEDNKLYIKYNFSKGIYVYTGVTQELFEQFLVADSKGKFAHEHIIGRYPTEKICD